MECEAVAIESTLDRVVIAPLKQKDIQKKSQYSSTLFHKSTINTPNPGTFLFAKKNTYHHEICDRKRA
jgi:hypothetical protein